MGVPLERDQPGITSTNHSHVREHGFYPSSFCLYPLRTPQIREIERFEQSQFYVELLNG